MTEPDAEYITPDEAAVHLGKSAAQVRRDARKGRLHSIKKSGRVWIHVDERFQELKRNPYAQFPPAPGTPPTHGPDAGVPATDDAELQSVLEDLILEVGEFRAEVAHLTARVRRMELRAGDAAHASSTD